MSVDLEESVTLEGKIERFVASRLIYEVRSVSAK